MKWREAILDSTVKPSEARDIWDLNYEDPAMKISKEEHTR